jgi:preprotein translocase subunit SecA
LSVLDKIFGPSESKTLSRYKDKVKKINDLEEEMVKKSDKELKESTDLFKKRLAKNEPLDNLLSEAFATVREASKRTIGQRHFDVQLMGGMILHEGKIAEMRTGEGKTLVATLPVYLNALTGEGVHLVTVNDFLAKFQGQWMGQVYHSLGLSTGVIGHEQSYIYTPVAQPVSDETWKYLMPVSRKQAYNADITYGTNNEFGFDYLRDNMAQSLEQVSQRGLAYAIVDEVDSILIDEARTPLIISAPARESTSLYQQFATLVKKLKEEDYIVDEKARSAALSDSGIKKVESYLGIDNLYEVGNVANIHHCEEALKAQVLFKKDKDYVVKDGEIIIVDEFTGRLMPGRRYSEGLHQAIEAKEGVEVKRESETLATISFQNLFRLYKKLAGMTGTAITESEEFYKIYNLDVAITPTNRPMIRIDKQDKIYKTEIAKFNAVVEDVKSRHEKGQPVLVGTASINHNEQLSKLLDKAGIRHQLLNAKQHEQEAKIIAQAGRKNAVTIATNIAGRGVDIILGGTTPSSGDIANAKEDQDSQDAGLANLSHDHRTIEEWEKEHSEVLQLGGLAVIGTERHESRRIDNQLRGRAGRQGDPGESTFYVSMEDDLMRIFGGERIKNMMNRLGLPDDVPIEHNLISKSISQAQSKVEGHNFDIRKNLVEYDDVMNKHREAIYRKRRSVLEGKGRDENGEEIDLHEEILSIFNEEEEPVYRQKIERFGIEITKQIEQQIYLRVIDQLWIDHLNAIEELRTGIGLRGYGQRDPLIEYKQEAYKMFEYLLDAIDAQIIDLLLRVEISSEVNNFPPAPMPTKVIEQGALEETSSEVIKETSNSQGSAMIKPNKAINTDVSVSVRKKGQSNSQVDSSVTSSVSNKVGRNDLCPCGSGKKYKKCHGK